MSPNWLFRRSQGLEASGSFSVLTSERARETVNRLEPVLFVLPDLRGVSLGLSASRSIWGELLARCSGGNEMSLASEWLVGLEYAMPAAAA